MKKNEQSEKSPSPRPLDLPPEAGCEEPYYPPLDAQPNCSKCGQADCPARGKFQRGRQDFTVTSGRCPRLPDSWGMVEAMAPRGERDFYWDIFPLATVLRQADGHLTFAISIPGRGRDIPLHRTPARLRNVWELGHWYIREGKLRRVVALEGDPVEKDLSKRMDYHQRSRLTLRASVTDTVYDPADYAPVQPAVKRGRGRPRKTAVLEAEDDASVKPLVKRGRGRPRKTAVTEAEDDG